MIMGNFLSSESLRSRMAARPPAIGISHPTIVPSNFEGSTDEHTDDESEDQ